MTWFVDGVTAGRVYDSNTMLWRYTRAVWQGRPLPDLKPGYLANIKDGSVVVVSWLWPDMGRRGQVTIPIEDNLDKTIAQVLLVAG